MKSFVSTWLFIILQLFTLVNAQNSFINNINLKSFTKEKDSIYALSVDNKSVVIANGVESASEGQYFQVRIDTLQLIHEGIVLDATSHGDTVYLWTRNDPCCMGNMIRYHLMAIVNDSIVNLIQVANTVETAFPTDESSIGHTAIRYVAEGIVRATPFIDDTSEFFDLHQQGNQIGRIDGKAEVVVLASSRIENRDWLFVAARNSSVLKDSFCSGNDDFLLGWIIDETEITHIMFP